MHALVAQHFMGAVDAATAAGLPDKARALRRELMVRVKKAQPPDAGVWLQVLRFLARTHEVGTEDPLIADACRCCCSLGSEDLLSPLAVVSALTEGNPALPFGIVRDFVLGRLQADAEAIADDASIIEQLRADAVALLDESHRLATVPVVFQGRKCRSCGGDLDLPTVHFLCGGPAEEHVFHLRCVAGGGGGSDAAPPECPLCAPSQATVREGRASIGPRAFLQEQFEQEMATSKGEAVGRGVAWFGLL